MKCKPLGKCEWILCSEIMQFVPIFLIWNNIKNPYIFTVFENGIINKWWLTHRKSNMLILPIKRLNAKKVREIGGVAQKESQKI